MTERFLTPAEIATLLRIHPRKAYRLIHQGDIPGVVQVGREFRVDATRLEDWINSGGTGRTANERSD